jgi:hypothetical protein
MLSPMRISLLSLLFFSDIALGYVVKRFPSSTYSLKEHHYVPRAWPRVGDAPPDHILSLRIGLTQGRFDELEKDLYEGTENEMNQLLCVRMRHHLALFNSLRISQYFIIR